MVEHGGMNDDYSGDAGRYGETDKSLVTKQEANLFNVIEAQIVRVIIEQLGCEAVEVSHDATFESLGADSLDHVELVMAFEDEFGIEISDGESEAVKTVRQAFDLIAAKIA